MTELEWLTCTDPARMLRFLHQNAGERKPRLFGAACLRRVWSYLIDDRSKEAVAVLEQWVDNETGSLSGTDALELAAAAKDAVFNAAYASGHNVVHPTVYAANAVYDFTFFSLGWTSGIAAARGSRRTLAAAIDEEDEARRVERAESSVQAEILRDVFNNPFRRSLLHLDQANCCTDGIIRIAQEVYEHRSFERLGLLGAELEEAGCPVQHILDHCRSEGSHVRGCWVVDLILGKE